MVTNQNIAEIHDQVIVDFRDFFARGVVRLGRDRYPSMSVKELTRRQSHGETDV